MFTATADSGLASKPLLTTLGKACYKQYVGKLKHEFGKTLITDIGVEEVALIRSGIHSSHSSDGNPRSPHRAPLAVAEQSRQATHRLTSSGMPRSYGGVWGGGLAPRTTTGPDSSILEQRRSAFPTQPNRRRHRGDPHPWRTPPSICSRVFGKDSQGIGQ
jgi:hypothetical protein